LKFGFKFYKVQFSSNVFTKNNYVNPDHATFHENVVSWDSGSPVIMLYKNSNNLVVPLLLGVVICCCCCVDVFDIKSTCKPIGNCNNVSLVIAVV
jgi:hypothetical protein